MAKKKKLGYFNPTRKQYVDADYLDKLSPSELEWYRRFSQEYYNQTFKENILDRLDQREDAYKESYTRDNACRRDIMNQWYRSEKDELSDGEVLRVPPKK